MRWKNSVLKLALVGMSLLSACRATGPGPKAWLDNPLDQSRHPLAPVEVIAHASSQHGVSAFEIFIDGDLLGTITAGGARMEMATHIWEPQASGIYNVSVRASDNRGSTGLEAASEVIIGDVPLQVGEGQNVGYGTCEGIEAFEARVEPAVIPPGACTLLHWEVIAPEEWSVLIDNQPYGHVGEIPICLDQTEIVHVEVETPNGLCSNWRQVRVSEEMAGREEPLPELEIIFNAEPSVIPSGACSTLYWGVFPRGDFPVFVNGQQVAFEGERLECPSQTSEYVLFADHPQRPREAVAVIEVLEGETVDDSTSTPSASASEPTQGSAPPTSTSAPAPTSTPKPAATNTAIPDTTPPVISGASINPNDFVFTSGGSCTPTAFLISASVTDAGGVKSVVLNWDGQGVRDGPANMNYVSGKYEVSLGLFVNSGNLTNFTITARDNAGNQSTYSPGWNVAVEQCGGGS